MKTPNKILDEYSGKLAEINLSAQELLAQYPASSLVRLIGLNEYKKQKNPEWDALKNRFGIYMNNPLWYSFIASEIKEDTDVQPDTEAEVEVEDQEEEPVVPIDLPHTVDYFASQGIKLTERDLKDDHLSQQVRSFTGWLKQMKKVHPGRLATNTDFTDRIVLQVAEKSNVNEEVYTEAMAEVQLKQNRIDKAIEIYEKLSLMNPSKSAYFAAKIENLKTT